VDKLLTVADAAERAGVSISLVYQWVDERRLAHFRVGGRGKRGKILISPRDLDGFMDSLKVEPPGDPGEAAYRRHLR
jgi:excisionase family DNA binding protein